MKQATFCFYCFMTLHPKLLYGNRPMPIITAIPKLSYHTTRKKRYEFKQFLKY